MTDNLFICENRKLGIIGFVLLITTFVAFSGDALAMSTVTVDGIKTVGEYTRPTTQQPEPLDQDVPVSTTANSGSKTIHWFNNHDTVYGFGEPTNTGPPEYDPYQLNPLYWEINPFTVDTVEKTALNLFFEVPDFARRMIWADGCVFQTGDSVGGAGCGALLGGDNSPGNVGDVLEILEAYDQGSHHGDVKMDYGTQTGSEFFQLNSDDVEDPTSVFYSKWQTEDTNGLDDGVTWKTSREYLLGNNICTEALCLAFDTTASIELMMLFDTRDEARAYLDSVKSMLLHLSDPAKNLPAVPKVPVPAAFWLFGTALIGFIGFSRRTNLS